MPSGHGAHDSISLECEKRPDCGGRARRSRCAERAAEPEPEPGVPEAPRWGLRPKLWRPVLPRPWLRLSAESCGSVGKRPQLSRLRASALVTRKGGP